MRDRKDIAADMAWPVIAEREGLPQPRDSFKSAVPPEALHARREFKRGGFVMLWFAVAALWTCLGIYLVNNWDWVSAVVGGVFA